ncbi:MAG: hypothetical protein HRT57_14045 [Crocinitomicaceae bacterium]|nr:hypothetical protein [Crocinitomicaceae bacterium]
MRKVIKYFLLCAVGVFTLGSCGKDVIELPESNDPVFTLNGTLAGIEFNLIAGDDNAFMHTGTEMVNGVNLFKGELGDGNFSLELGIFDGMVDRPGHITVEELQNIVPTFASRSNEPLLVLSKYKLGSNQAIESVDWYINNEFAGLDEVEIDEPGKYAVCAFITFTNGDFNQLCEDIIVGYERSANFTIQYDLVAGAIEGNILAIDEDVQSVEWFVNDSAVGSNPILNQSIDSESTRLKAIVHFANGAVREKAVIIDGQDDFYSAKSFSTMEMSSPYSGSNQDFNIRLKIKLDGKTYLSEYANNENSSLFITDVELYGPNSEGNDVYKVSGIVNAVVMEEVSQKMISVTFVTVFGVEIH